MTSTEAASPARRSRIAIVLAFVAGAAIMAALAALLVNIHGRMDEAARFPLQVVAIPADELDPAVWGRDFPREYDSFRKTEDDTSKTDCGGSVPYDKLERNPDLKRLWAGYAFAVDHNEDRGHHYAQIDQARTKRVQVVKQPGACINCHAAEAPKLIAEMGWEAFNRTPYDELKGKLHYGVVCADCHDPATMALRITRPALRNALAERGIDLGGATRQEMRTYVCAQCHVEYYFKGDDKILTFPWRKGLAPDDIEAHYDEYGFKDWTHKESGAAMIKIQHPEYELWSTGIHARSGVACADCHMPYVREGAVKVTDHWIRSPLADVARRCGTCHRRDEKELRERVLAIQNTTAGLLRRAEKAIIDAIDAIAAAKAAGAADADLADARALHRRASLRWDFISSENSTGFHSPLQAARTLADAIDYARQAQIAAGRLKGKA